MAVTFDGPNKIIQLDGSTIVSIPALYSRWVDWVATSDNSKYVEAFTTVADPPKVPVYATLVNGWRVRPTAGDYILTFRDGFLDRESGLDPFAPVVSGQEPRIRWENPVIAVGYSTSGGAGLSPADIAAIQAAVWTYMTRTLTSIPPASVDPQSVRDAMLLAPSAGAPAANSVDDKLDKIKNNTGLIPALL